MSLVPDICEEIKRIHEKKGHDYAQVGNAYSNFERASVLADWFKDPVDKTFATIIGIKLARLAELLNGKTPKNESKFDSFLDLCTYCVIWYSYRKENQNGKI